MTINKKAKELGLDRCDFDDECDFCNNPQNGSWVKLIRGYDYTDTGYYVCGKCISENKSKDKKI